MSPRPNRLGCFGIARRLKFHCAPGRTARRETRARRLAVLVPIPIRIEARKRVVQLRRRHHHGPRGQADARADLGENRQIGRVAGADEESARPRLLAHEEGKNVVLPRRVSGHEFQDIGMDLLALQRHDRQTELAGERARERSL